MVTTAPSTASEKAIEDAYAENILGKNILGSDFSFDIEVALDRRLLRRRRRDGHDGGHRGQALHAALQAAVPRRSRTVDEADYDQQRQDILVRSPDRSERRGVVLQYRREQQHWHCNRLSNRQRYLSRHLRGRDGHDHGSGHRGDRRRRPKRQADEAPPDGRPARWRHRTRKPRTPHRF